MKLVDLKLRDFIAGVGGAVIGAATGYIKEDPFFNSHKWIQFAAVGGIIGLLILPVYRWLFAGREIVLENLEITLFGVKTKVGITEAHRLIGWRIFVEAATRISTQELKQNEGSLREALTSLYKLFDIVRTELKTQLPSAPPEREGSYTIESYAVRMLNDAVRPMLQRWHPILASWEKMSGRESEWKLAAVCREDLEKTRLKVVEYVRGLGAILKIHDLDNILPPMVDSHLNLALATQEEIGEKEKGAGLYLDESHRAAGWRIFVELTSRIATQPMEAHTGDIREAFDSLYKLYDIIREEIKKLNPMDRGESDADTIEKIAIPILNGNLRRFLTKWHPLLSEWEKQTAPKTVWDQEADCRADLELLRQTLVEEVKKLGELINIKVEDYMPG